MAPSHVIQQVVPASESSVLITRPTFAIWLIAEMQSVGGVLCASAGFMDAALMP
jgi:hypothetical protein